MSDDEPLNVRRPGGDSITPDAVLELPKQSRFGSAGAYAPDMRASDGGVGDGGQDPDGESDR